MNYKQFKLLLWNVRGLGSASKCGVVRNVIRRSRCHIVCIQESKWNTYDLAYVASVLPSYFEMRCVLLNAQGRSGGCIIAWKRDYELINCFVTKHTCSAILRQPRSGKNMHITTVYGPSEDNEKILFMEEIRKLAELVQHPWMLVGDFNLVRWLVDHSGDMRGFGLMCAFNDLIRDFQLVDVPLENRKYTWSNKQPAPILSKIDRCLITPEWALQLLDISLQALEVIVSDHAPMLLQCKHRQQRKAPMRLKRFWLQYAYTAETVRTTWEDPIMEQGDVIKIFEKRMNAVHVAMREWHRKHFGQMNDQLQKCKESILNFDKKEEQGPLARGEFIQRQKLRETAYELSNNIELRWQQRSRCN